MTESSLQIRGNRWIVPMFLVAGLYDFVLGLMFLLIPGQIYTFYGVTLPNHMAYVQFPAALLIIFGLMFFQVARDPLKYHMLIPYGLLLKAAYSGIVVAYWVLNAIPDLWKPFAVADGAFFILFYLAWRHLRGTIPES